LRFLISTKIKISSERRINSNFVDKTSVIRFGHAFRLRLFLSLTKDDCLTSLADSGLAVTASNIVPFDSISVEVVEDGKAGLVTFSVVGLGTSGTEGGEGTGGELRTGDGDD